MIKRDFSSEFWFLTSRSSGAGGQNVNKVSTKVTLCFDIDKSVVLCDEEKIRVKAKLVKKINSDGILLITSQSERTQLGNKELCIQKLYQLIEKALSIPKKRKPSKPTYESVQKRLEKKRRSSEQKLLRKKIDD